MEENKELELRMYFFVPYNISPIQQAIQAGHSALEYAYKNSNGALFINFMDNWKTWIILNGGTTNSHRDLEGIAIGTLDQIGDSLLENDIDFSFFEEPDLNDTLTAICFICDERVFNKKDYPDFTDYLIPELELNDGKEANFDYIKIKMTNVEILKEKYFDIYKKWVKLIGGIKNEFLRELLKDKHLA
jgi:hypothetical protein